MRACGMKGALVEFGNFQRLELLTLDAAELSHHHYHQATWIPAGFSLVGLCFSLSKCMLIVFSVLRVRRAPLQRAGGIHNITARMKKTCL